MLFRNVKTGNMLAVSNEDTIRLMRHSDIYEEVKPEKQKPVRKTPKKKD